MWEVEAAVVVVGIGAVRGRDPQECETDSSMISRDQAEEIWINSSSGTEKTEMERQNMEIQRRRQSPIKKNSNRKSQQNKESGRDGEGETEWSLSA